MKTEWPQYRLAAAVDKLRQWKLMYLVYLERLPNAQTFADKKQVLDDAAHALKQWEEANKTACDLFLEMQLHTSYARQKRLLQIDDGPWF